MISNRLAPLTYKVIAGIVVAINTCFLKTGNAMEFNWFEFLYVTISILIRQLKHVKWAGTLRSFDFKEVFIAATLNYSLLND
jgi:hypothetical protein